MGERPRGNNQKRRAQQSKFTKTAKVVKTKEIPSKKGEKK
jgi:hypothetical protein